MTEKFKNGLTLFLSRYYTSGTETQMQLYYMQIAAESQIRCHKKKKTVLQEIQLGL